MTAVEVEQAVNLFVEGKSAAEVALVVGRSHGSMSNLKSRKKDIILDRQRKAAVQFEDMTIVRKQARVGSDQELWELSLVQLRALIEAHQVIDGATRELMQKLEDDAESASELEVSPLMQAVS